MTSIDELMAQIPMDQVASQLGMSQEEAEQAVRTALPALVSGMQANASSDAGAQSLTSALGKHDGSLLDGGIDLNQVDTDDGQKIVNHIFGDNEQAVVNQLGGVGGLNAGSIAKLLPLLAPLLMGFLGKQFGGGGGGSDASPSSGGGGGLGDLLGGLLGGGGGGGLGDLLGGLLGKGN